VAGAMFLARGVGQWFDISPAPWKSWVAPSIDSMDGNSRARASRMHHGFCRSDPCVRGRSSRGPCFLQRPSDLPDCLLVDQKNRQWVRLNRQVRFGAVNLSSGYRLAEIL